MVKWDNIYKEQGAYLEKPLKFIRETLPLLKKRGAKNILDHGFGMGRHTVLLAQEGFQVYGIELSRTAKDHTESRLASLGLKANLQIGNSIDLPYIDNFFDAIIDTYTINHGKMQEIEKSFSELTRTLKPHGLIIMSLLSPQDGFYGKGKEIEPHTFLGVPDHDHDIPHHFFTEDEFRELLPDFTFLTLKEKKSYSKRRKCQQVDWEIIAEKI